MTNIQPKNCVFSHATLVLYDTQIHEHYFLGKVECVSTIIMII